MYDADSLDRYNNGERTNQCEDCGATFTHFSGCDRLSCDVCLAEYLRQEKATYRIWVAKYYGPPVVFLLVTTLMLGMPVLEFLVAFLVLVLAIYGVLITGEVAYAVWHSRKRCYPIVVCAHFGVVFSMFAVACALFWTFWYLVTSA
jgi:hypothetical protein